VEFSWFFGLAGFVCAVAVWEVLCEAAAADEDGFVLWFDFDGAVEVVADESGHGGCVLLKDLVCARVVCA